MWQVHQALYGYVESPSDWADHRDRKLKELCWVRDEVRYHLKATGEPHLWKIQTETGEHKGFLCVYVDDMAAAASEADMHACLDAIEGIWQCSPREVVDETSWVRFCGYELQRRKDGGYRLRQTSYIKDLINRRKIVGAETSPGPKIEAEEDEDPRDPGLLKEAQTVTGEVMWIASRTRPDIAYIVGAMSRLLHRPPGYVCKLGAHLMKYLNGTQEVGLEFHGQVGQQRKELVVAVDSSYAPPHEQYRSVQGMLFSHEGNPLMWSSTRQGFVTQSTAEAELMGYTEALQGGLSTMAQLEVLEIPIEKATILGDNQAAISLCCSDTGAWRTRHATRLRELLADDTSGWTLRFCPGSELIADGFTKSLQGQAFQKFKQMLNMGQGDTERKSVAKVEAGSAGTGRKASGALAVTSLAMLALGQKHLGALLAACALAVQGGSRWSQPATKDGQDPKRTGGGTNSTQDGKPYDGGATQDGKPSAGGATHSVQDGEAARRSSRSPAQGVVPGLKAFRSSGSSGSHGSQQPLPPRRGREAEASDGASTEAEIRVGYNQAYNGESVIAARNRAVSGRDGAAGIPEGAGHAGGA